MSIYLWVPTGKDGVYALYSVLTFYATKSLKIYGSCSTPSTLPICVSPTGKDGVYALFSVLTFYATKSLQVDVTDISYLF